MPAKPHYITHCAACERELKTRNPNSDIHMCSACWQKSKRGEPKRQLVKLRDAIQRAKVTISPRPRGTHRDNNYNNTNKQALTRMEAVQIKRIYGDEHIK